MNNLKFNPYPILKFNQLVSDLIRHINLVILDSVELLQEIRVIDTLSSLRSQRMK